MKKETDSFKKDILKLTGEQDKKILDLTNIISENSKILKDLTGIIKQGQQAPQPMQEMGNVVFTDITFARLISPEDTQQRANEVAGLVKPILEKYGVAKLNAFLVVKK